MQYLDDKFSKRVQEELLDMSSLMDSRFSTTDIDPDKLERIKKKLSPNSLSLASTDKSTRVQLCRCVKKNSLCLSRKKKKKKTLAAFFKKNAPVSTPAQPGAVKQRLSWQRTYWPLKLTRTLIHLTGGSAINITFQGWVIWQRNTSQSQLQVPPLRGFSVWEGALLHPTVHGSSLRQWMGLSSRLKMLRNSKEAPQTTVWCCC